MEDNEADEDNEEEEEDQLPALQAQLDTRITCHW